MPAADHLRVHADRDRLRAELDQAHRALDGHHVPRRVGTDGPTATLAWRINQLARRPTLNLSKGAQAQRDAELVHPEPQP